MKLVIVESPTKAKTISKFLGSKYTVKSSYGHIRDLPEKKMGIEKKTVSKTNLSEVWRVENDLNKEKKEKEEEKEELNKNSRLIV